jgi:hypothetical protein
VDRLRLAGDAVTLRERLDEAVRIVNEAFDEVEAACERAELVLVPVKAVWLDRGGEA